MLFRYISFFLLFSFISCGEKKYNDIQSDVMILATCDEQPKGGCYTGSRITFQPTSGTHEFNVTEEEQVTFIWTIENTEIETPSPQYFFQEPGVYPIKLEIRGKLFSGFTETTIEIFARPKLYYLESPYGLRHLKVNHVFPHEQGENYIFFNSMSELDTRSRFITVNFDLSESSNLQFPPSYFLPNSFFLDVPPNDVLIFSDEEVNLVDMENNEIPFNIHPVPESAINSGNDFLGFYKKHNNIKINIIKRDGTFAPLNPAAWDLVQSGYVLESIFPVTADEIYAECISLDIPPHTKLIQTDTSGQINWEKIIPFEDIVFYKKTTQGLFLVNKENRNYTFAMLDDFGETVWSLQFEQIGEPRFEALQADYSIFETSDHFLIFLDCFRIIKLDKNGSVIFDKIHGIKTDVFGYAVKNIRGNFLMFGTENWQGTTVAILGFEVDEQGEIIP